MKFVIKTVDDNKTVLSMEALGLPEVPDPKTVVAVADDYDWLADIVKDYITTGLSVRQIASRVDGYQFYTEYEPKMPKKPGQTLTEMIEEARRRIRQEAGQTDDQTPVQKDDEVTFTGTGLISKADEEQQIVYGWAYVTHDRDGNVVVDKSGDFVDDVVEIEKTAIRFMLNSRNTDVDHTNVKSGTIVESMVFTPEKIEKMGLPEGSIPLGWWIGTKVDDATWADYKAGRLRAFSVHGRGTRKSVEG